MGKHKAGVLTSTEVASVFDGITRAKAVGRIKWKYERRKLIGGIEVQTGIRRHPGGSLRFYAALPAPDQPGMQYLVSDIPLCRVDVNGIHNGHARQTHVHSYDSAGSDPAQMTDIGISLPHGVVPMENDYREIWEKFAAHVNVELSDNYWTKLPKEWTP